MEVVNKEKEAIKSVGTKSHTIKIYNNSTSTSTLATNFVFKFIIVGDTTAGKSSIISRISHGYFDRNLGSTIGVDFGTIHALVTPETRQYIPFINEWIDDMCIRIQLWDTAGQERYKSIVQSYYRGSTGIILAFDITNRNSFENVRAWYNEMVDKHSGIDSASIVLVGNKSDLDASRTVTAKEARELADELCIPYIETSAKSNTNITELFNQLILDICEKIIHGNINVNENAVGVRFMKSGYRYEVEPVYAGGCC